MSLKKTRAMTCLPLFLLVCFCTVSASPAFAGGASITGKINFQGTAPTPQPINFGPEKQCALAHPDTPPKDESVVVNPNGTVKWVLVHVTEGAAGPFEAPKEPLLVDQLGCIFTPHASAVMAGQPVTFQNSDSVLHNVRTLSKTGQNMNLAQPIQGMKTNKVFKNPEIGMQLRCDVHFWMTSYLHILDNPYYAITGDDGSYTLSGIPAGTYILEIWHEKLGTKTETVNVADGENKALDFSLGQ